MKIMNWFNKHWYRYILEKRNLSLRSIICRINGHKCGVIWYNSHWLEPDMRCKNCHDDLG